jgi:hypothetical protein
MRISFAVTLIGAFLAASFLLSTPAAATDARGALKACDKNPNCRPNTNDDGSVDLFITQVDGKKDWVSCPPRGACECMTCPRTQGKGGKIDPARVLNASPTRTTGAGPKNPRVPSGSILDGGSGFSHQGPSGMGTPAGAPPAASPRGPVLQ